MTSMLALLKMRSMLKCDHLGRRCPGDANSGRVVGDRLSELSFASGAALQAMHQRWRSHEAIYIDVHIHIYTNHHTWSLKGPKRQTVNLKPLPCTYARVQYPPNSQPSPLSRLSPTHLYFASLSQLIGVGSTRIGLRPCQSEGDQPKCRQHTQSDWKGLARLSSAGYRRASKHEGCEEGDFDTVGLARADTVAT